MIPATARRISGSWPCGLLVATSMLAGCAGPGGQARTGRPVVPAPSVTGTSACFYPRDVQDFRVLDRSNLVVYAPNESNAYHVRISPPSPDLRFADSLAFLPATGRICGYAGDRLVVGAPRSAESLSVIDVARLSPGSLQALRSVGEGGAVPAAPRPEPGPGADVEGAGVPPATDSAEGRGEK